MVLIIVLLFISFLSLCEKLYVCVLVCHRVAVVIMCLQFCKFIMSKIVCLCVCLHGFNYSIVVY